MSASEASPQRQEKEIPRIDAENILKLVSDVKAELTRLAEEDVTQKREAQEALVRIEENLTQLSNELAQKQEQLAETRAEETKTDNSHNVLQRELEGINGELRSVQALILQKTTVIEEKEGEVRRLDQNRKTPNLPAEESRVLHTAYQTACGVRDSLKLELVTANQQASGLDDRQFEASQSLVALSTKLKNIRRDINTLNTDIIALEGQIAILDSEKLAKNSIVQGFMARDCLREEHKDGLDEVEHLLTRAAIIVDARRETFEEVSEEADAVLDILNTIHSGVLVIHREVEDRAEDLRRQIIDAYGRLSDDRNTFHREAGDAIGEVAALEDVLTAAHTNPANEAVWEDLRRALTHANFCVETLELGPEIEQEEDSEGGEAAEDESAGTAEALRTNIRKALEDIDPRMLEVERETLLGKINDFRSLAERLTGEKESLQTELTDEKALHELTKRLLANTEAEMQVRAALAEQGAEAILRSVDAAATHEPVQQQPSDAEPEQIPAIEPSAIVTVATPEEQPHMPPASTTVAAPPESTPRQPDAAQTPRIRTRPRIAPAEDDK